MNELHQKLESLKGQALQAFLNEKTADSLYQMKVYFLGKKGLLTDILKDLGKLPPEDRPQVGALANQLKNELEKTYQSRLNEIQRTEVEQKLKSESIDVTLPAVGVCKGSIHPVSQILTEICSLFADMGFDIFEGPEIETDYYNFEALNIPKNHPTRDMHDTFFLPDQRVLRTHTSPVQIRLMEKEKPPLRMIAPGVVYRRDSDVTHTPMFHQVEGLVVDENITLAHLKGVVETFLRKIFDSKTRVKFRPSFFPFTEPSAEVDIGCVFCKGDGCRVCKQTGWLEIMGCGMVDPEVFCSVSIDSERYTGFAFGMGVERIAMLKLGIDDIRLFFENEIDFLKQF